MDIYKQDGLLADLLKDLDTGPQQIKTVNLASVLTKFSNDELNMVLLKKDDTKLALLSEDEKKQRIKNIKQITDIYKQHGITDREEIRTHLTMFIDSIITQQRQVKTPTLESALAQFSTDKLTVVLLKKDDIELSLLSEDEKKQRVKDIKQITDLYKQHGITDREEIRSHLSGLKVFQTKPRLATVPLINQLRSRTIPIWHHVCSTVCTPDHYTTKYPLCSCNSIGEKISKSVVRNAVTRIFSDPAQSIMEPVVNSFDSYALNEGTSIGKFGIGFFSFLHSLLIHPDRTLQVLTRNEGSKIIYILKIWLTSKKNGSSDDLSFNINTISLDNLKLELIKEAIICYDNIKELTSFTNLSLFGSFSEEELLGYHKYLERLRYFESRPLFINGKLSNLVSSEDESCVSVLLNKDEVQINDMGKGMNLNTILRSLLVPAISSKTVHIPKYTRTDDVIGKTDLYFRDEMPNNPKDGSRFVITVSDVSVVDLPLTSLYSEVSNDFQSYLNKVFPPIEIRFDLFSNTSLPVARDDVILSVGTLDQLKVQIRDQIIPKLYSTYANLIPLQKGLMSYFTHSSQKKEVTELIDFTNYEIKSFCLAKDILPVNINLACLLLKYKLSSQLILLVNNLEVDEKRLISKLFPDQILDNNRFAERMVVYLPNYILVEPSTIGTQLYLFVPERYRATKYNDYLRYISPTYLSEHSNFYNILLGKKKISNEKMLELARVYCIYFSLFSDLCHRFTNEIVTPIFNYDILFNWSHSVVNYDSMINYYKCLTTILERLRFLLLNEHQTYGQSNDLATCLKQFNDEVYNLRHVYLYYRIYQYNLLLKGIDFLMQSQSSSKSIIGFLNMRWLLNYSLEIKIGVGYTNQVIYLYLNLVLKFVNKLGSKYDYLERMISSLNRLCIDNGVSTKVEQYLEKHISMETLIKECELICNGHGGKLNRTILNNLCNIIDQHNDPKYNALCIYEPVFLKAPAKYQFLLSVYISEILKTAQPPTTPLEYQKFFTQVESTIDASKPSNWQLVELAINAGTTIDPTIMAITEAVQNSIDAIRKRASTTIPKGVVKIQHGKLKTGEYYFSIYDDVGIPLASYNALTIPYYSQKDSTDPNVTGEMGNGLFNIYREATTVEITTHAPGCSGFTIIDIPQRNPTSGLVDDLHKTVSLTYDKAKVANFGTAISVILPNDTDKYQTSFINLNYNLDKFMSISPEIVALDINNGQLTNTLEYHPTCLELIGKKPSGYYTQYQDIKKPFGSDVILKVCFPKDTNVNSYLLTRGIPFQPLSVFLEQNYPKMNQMTHLFNKGIFFNIISGYSPVQSRSKITLTSEMLKAIENTLYDSLFIKELFGLSDCDPNDAKLIENYSSTADPAQLSFNTSTLATNGSVSKFMTYYKSSYLESLSSQVRTNSIASIINKEILSFTSANKFRFKHHSAQVEALIKGWFKNKKVDPPGTNDIIVVGKKSTNPVLIKTEKNPNEDQQLQYVVYYIDKLFNNYIELYTGISKQVLKSNFTAPKINILINSTPTRIRAYYMSGDHAISYNLGDKLNIGEKLKAWNDLFKSIVDKKQDENRLFKDIFGKNSINSCIVDHELLHAIDNETSINVVHGTTSVTLNGTRHTDEFEKIAVLIRTEFDKHKMTARFLDQARILLNPLFKK